MRRLSLDHITVADTTPSQLAETAARVGCAGICLFLHPMPVLPAMPDFELIGDTAERRRTSDMMRAGGLTLDLAYPFTMGGRTIVADFEPALETVAWLGGGLINVLCYDRDPERRLDRLAELIELAKGYRVELAIEFYPPSQIRSLTEVLRTIDVLGRSEIGVTVDLLHLTRAGEIPDALHRLGDPRIRIAQLSDGPVTMPSDRIEWEAGIERLLPGEGSFDCAAFAAALLPDVPVSAEVPRQSAIDAGVSIIDRARAAVTATRCILGEEQKA